MADDPVIAADAVDPVPWAIHGAKHSADVARQNTYDSTGGAEGVSSPTALAVRATQTPSNQVRVAPGGALMLSPFDVGQTYNFRVAKEALVDVPASSSLGANTWYINAWINDPNKPGGTEPASTAFGPYAFLTCDAEPKGDFPHYTPAKIVVPEDTAAIDDDYITDLRKLAQPKREPLIFARPRVLEDQATRFLTQPTSTGGEKFPGGNGDPNAFQVDVPEWATRILIDASWMSVLYKNGTNPWGRYWIEYGLSQGSWPNNQQYEFTTQQFAFDSPSGNNMRAEWHLMSSQHLPAKLRGQRIVVAFMAGRNDTGPNDAVSMDYLSGLGMHITFVQTTLDPKSNEDPI